MAKVDKNEVDKNDGEYDFKAGFNIFSEEKDYAWLATTRVEHTREWAPRLLRWALILNTIAAIFYSAAFVVMLTKPAPIIYSSTERGSIFKMEKIK